MQLSFCQHHSTQAAKLIGCFTLLSASLTVLLFSTVLQVLSGLIRHQTLTNLRMRWNYFQFSTFSKYLAKVALICNQVYIFPRSIFLRAVFFFNLHES